MKRIASENPHEYITFDYKRWNLPKQLKQKVPVDAIDVRLEREAHEPRPPHLNSTNNPLPLEL